MYIVTCSKETKNPTGGAGNIPAYAGPFTSYTDAETYRTGVEHGRSIGPGLRCYADHVIAELFTPED